MVMGVINTTPDSFSDGGVHFRRDDAVQSGLGMLACGADMLDIGGESTRPGAEYVEEAQEVDRVTPVIEDIRSHAPDAVISIDTRRRKVAEAAVKAGATIINDVSGFRHDPSLAEFARDCGAAVIIMHMLGEPRTMQVDIRYNDFPKDLLLFFQERLDVMSRLGINLEKIIIDPGIGFGKTYDQNLVLINRAELFTCFGVPVLIGPSRKAFLGKILGLPIASDRDTGTLGAIAAAALNGASIVRVHDVAPAVQVCRVIDAIKRESLEAGSNRIVAR